MNFLLYSLRHLKPLLLVTKGFKNTCSPSLRDHFKTTLNWVLWETRQPTGKISPVAMIQGTCRWPGTVPIGCQYPCFLYPITVLEIWMRFFSLSH